MKTDPIFIVEDNGSGSNYLATLIAKHPDIGIAPESNFILDLMYHFRNRILKSQKDIDEAIAIIFQPETSKNESEVDFSAFGINSRQLKSFLNSTLPATVPDIVNFILSQYCRRHFPGCSTWGIKKGCYVFELDKLVRYFPRAKFIHIVRDGRAVYAAQKRSLLKPTGEPLELDPIQAAKRWNRVTQCFEAFQKLYPHNALEISHETLVQQRETILSKVFNFLEVPDLDIPPGAKFLSQSAGQSPGEYPDKTTLPQLDAWQKELTPLEIYLYETVAGHHLKRKHYALIAEKHMQRPMPQPASYKQWTTQPNPSRSKFSFLRAIKLARNRLT
jgi:Sulfotransferase family